MPKIVCQITSKLLTEAIPNLKSFHAPGVGIPLGHMMPMPGCASAMLHSRSGESALFIA